MPRCGASPKRARKKAPNLKVLKPNSRDRVAGPRMGRRLAVHGELRATIGTNGVPEGAALCRKKVGLKGEKQLRFWP